MSSSIKPQQVAVIGAGMAGATCAQALAQAGHRVQVFDKARGPGGRLATRRQTWAESEAQPTHFDHGAPGFAARSEAFRCFVNDARQAGSLVDWAPAFAPGSLPMEGGGMLHLPVPDMPELARRLLHGVAGTWSCQIDQLHRQAGTWFLQSAGATKPQGFDAVVLALPPAQAAPLIGLHHPAWARQAAIVPMQACWTLMGVAAEPTAGPHNNGAPAEAWDLARPPHGPLATVMRSDRRPGRAHVPGQALWVAHARNGWSRQHLEEAPAWIEQQLRQALADWLGRPVEWRHSAVHRWRFALPPVHSAEPAASCWWDAGLGLGVCGDFLGGVGVEGAWLSARALAARMLAQTAVAGPVAAAAHGHGEAMP